MFSFILSLLFLFLSSVTESDDTATIVLYFSPLTTHTDLEMTQKRLDELGHDISLSDAKFTEEGFLESYEVKIGLTCEGEDYNLSSPVYLNKYLLGVTLIGEDCQHASYSVMNNKDDMTAYFFQSTEPDVTLVTWNGKLSDLDSKHISDFFKK